MTAAIREHFDAFLNALTATAQADADIVGLVGMGSSAERDRVDAWSDHDFALLTVPGTGQRFWDRLGWHPDAEGIAFRVREHHGVMKVIYDDGRVLEIWDHRPRQSCRVARERLRRALRRRRRRGRDGQGRRRVERLDTWIQGAASSRPTRPWAPESATC